MRDLYIHLRLDLPKIEITPNIQRLMWELSNHDRHKQKVVDLVTPPQLQDMADSLAGLTHFAFPYLPTKYQSITTSFDSAIGFDKTVRTTAYFDNESRFKPLTIDTNIFLQNFGFRCSSLYKALISQTKESRLLCKQTAKHPYFDLSTLGEKEHINLLNNFTINKLNNLKKCIIAK